MEEKSERSRWEDQEVPTIPAVTEFLKHFLPDTVANLILSYGYLGKYNVIYLAHYVAHPYTIELKRYKNRFYCQTEPIFRDSWFRLMPNSRMHYRPVSNVEFPSTKWKVQEPTQSQKGVQGQTLSGEIVEIRFNKRSCVRCSLGKIIHTHPKVNIVKIQVTKSRVYIYVEDQCEERIKKEGYPISLLVYPLVRNSRLVQFIKKIDFGSYAFDSNQWTIFCDYLVHLHDKRLSIFDLSGEDPDPLLIQSISLPIAMDPSAFNTLYACGNELYVTEDGEVYRVFFSSFPS